MQISMLWNWYTVDACFLSETWHVRNKGQLAISAALFCRFILTDTSISAQYAGTLIGIFLSTVLSAARQLPRSELTTSTSFPSLPCGGAAEVVMSVELVRRIGREYDRRLLSAYMAKLSSSSVNALNKNDGTLDIACAVGMRSLTVSRLCSGLPADNVEQQCDAVHLHI